MQPATPLPMMKMPGSKRDRIASRDITFQLIQLTAAQRPRNPCPQKRIAGQVSSSDHDRDYRNLAVNRLRPSEIQWALNHDAVHGIAYAFKNPVAVAEATEDPGDDRKTYLIRVKRDDLANALDKINEWILDNPGPSGMQAYGFVRALSREGLTDRAIGDDDPR